MNRERFQKLHERFSAHPEQLKMSTWEHIPYVDSCGTTRCIAGWTIHDEIGGPLRDSLGGLTDQYVALCQRLGTSCNFSHVAARLLDLDDGVAEDLFYTDDDTAVEFVRLVARGREEEARVLLADSGADADEGE